MARTRARRTADKRPACEHCGNEVRPTDPGVYREVRGWVQNRSQGGANAVSKMVGTGRYGCATCMALVIRGIDPKNPEPQTALPL